MGKKVEEREGQGGGEKHEGNYFRVLVLQPDKHTGGYMKQQC